jgi:hypothetical protein
MSSITRKVLIVKYDVTELPQGAIDSLQSAAIAQSDNFEMWKGGEPMDMWFTCPNETATLEECFCESCKKWIADEDMWIRNPNICRGCR